MKEHNIIQGYINMYDNTISLQDVAWAQWRLKSPEIRLVQQRVQTNDTEDNIRTPYYWPFWEGFPSHWWCPLRKG